MRTPRRWWWPALIVAAGSAAALLPLPWLVVLEGDHVRYAFPATAGSAFTLRWNHSVEQEDWEERFQIQPDGGLMLVETRFKTFGAGVPARVGQHTRLENGWVVMSGIQRVVDPLNIQTAARGHYRLRYRWWTLALTRPGVPPVLTFTTRDAPLLTMLPALLRGTAVWRGP